MATTQINGATQIQAVTITNAEIAAAAAIATTKLANGPDFIQRGGSVAFTADQSMAGFKLINVGTPSTSTDAATKGYVDTVVVGLLDFKGNQDASTNPNYPAASKGDAYYVSVAGKIGGASGKVVSVGDVFVANADNAGGTEASVGTSWFVMEGNIAGLSANGISLITAADYAAMRALLDLEAGTDFYSISAADSLLAAKAPLASPTFTGVPAAPTAAPGTNTTQLATTAFVTAAIAALPGGSTLVPRETPSGTVNGSNVTFTLAFTPISGTEHVYLNGILQEPGAGNDYTISSATITYLTAPLTGDKIRVTYWR